MSATNMAAKANSLMASNAGPESREGSCARLGISKGFVRIVLPDMNHPSIRHLWSKPEPVAPEPVPWSEEKKARHRKGTGGRHQSIAEKAAEWARIVAEAKDGEPLRIAAGRLGFTKKRYQYLLRQFRHGKFNTETT
jgi:hypothetical protein